jgi:hypothetical protein
MFKEKDHEESIRICRHEWMPGIGMHFNEEGEKTMKGDIAQVVLMTSPLLFTGIDSCSGEKQLRLNRA